MILVPALLAYVFGWLAFRSRVTGVYLSILTQAFTLALSLYLFQNESGLRGNNGLSGLQNLPHVTASQDFVALWLFWASAVALGLGYILASVIVAGKFGSVIRAIRDEDEVSILIVEQNAAVAFGGGFERVYERGAGVGGSRRALGRGERASLRVRAVAFGAGLRRREGFALRARRDGSVEAMRVVRQRGVRLDALDEPRRVQERERRAVRESTRDGEAFDARVEVRARRGSVHEDEVRGQRPVGPRVRRANDRRAVLRRERRPHALRPARYPTRGAEAGDERVHVPVQSAHPYSPRERRALWGVPRFPRRGLHDGCQVLPQNARREPAASIASAGLEPVETFPRPADR